MDELTAADEPGSQEIPGSQVASVGAVGAAGAVRPVVRLTGREDVVEDMDPPYIDGHLCGRLAFASIPAYRKR
ncbi:hypothetical protein GCM10023160_00880 [Brachybacterium paraconglomeratum]